MLLEGKVIVVSGIGPGLGVKLAVEAAREGARGIVLAARSAAKLEDAEARVRAVSTSCQTLKIPTDIRDPVQCGHLAAAALDRFGRIDGLINSAFEHGAFEPVDSGEATLGRSPREDCQALHQRCAGNGVDACRCCPTAFQARSSSHAKPSRATSALDAAGPMVPAA